MKSLNDYINECLNECLNESVLDIDINTMSDDELKSFIKNWINEHNISSEGELSTDRTKQNIESFTITNKGVDIITPGGYKEKIHLLLVGEESIPFKINKLDGFITIRETKKFDGDNLPNECGGMNFEYVSKLNWKNGSVKFTKRENNRYGWGLSFYKSPSIMKSIRNISFNFTGTDSWCTIDVLKPKSLDNIKFKNLDHIYVSDKISMSDEELSTIGGVKYISSYGNEFVIKNGVWK